MTQEIQNVLQSWETSIMHFNKLDAWTLTDDLSKMSSFIRINKGGKKLVDYVRYCRDYALNNHPDTQLILANIHKALDCINAKLRKPKGIIKTGLKQSERFRDTTKSLFHEKLKFKDNERLRNIDVTIEDPKTVKKVRKIVEKRMCQAYYKLNKHSFRDENNRSKHNMKRAVSYQLFNIGQVEEIENMPRTASTHWKRCFDPCTNTTVYKKKVAYNTLEEAQQAVELFHKRHPHQVREVQAYECAYCHKYHIGHSTEDFLN